MDNENTEEIQVKKTRRRRPWYRRPRNARAKAASPTVSTAEDAENATGVMAAGTTGGIAEPAGVKTHGIIRDDANRADAANSRSAADAGMPGSDTRTGTPEDAGSAGSTGGGSTGDGSATVASADVGSGETATKSGEIKKKRRPPRRKKGAGKPAADKGDAEKAAAVATADEKEAAPKADAGKVDAGKPEAGKPEAGKADSGKKRAGEEAAEKAAAQKTAAGKTAVDKTAAKRTTAEKTAAKKAAEKAAAKKTAAEKTAAKKTAAGKTASEDVKPPAPSPTPSEADAGPGEVEPVAAKERRKRTGKASGSRAKVVKSSVGDERTPMNREILVSAAKDETRVALVEDGSVVEFYLERPSSQKIAGSIFLGKVTNVLPGMQAAFIDIGEEKNAFLYVDDAVLPPNLEDSDAIPDIKGRRRRTITDLVKPGQEVMVQVVKEAIGTKGARVTRHVTFPGRYMVLMPTVSYVGVSRRITEDDERKRLRQIARDLKPEDMGIIIRTVAEKKNKEELEKDLAFLLRVWEKVQRRAHSSKAPCLVHSDLGLVFRVVRDELNQDTTRMLVDDVNTYSRILDLLESVSPEMKERVIYYRDKEYPLFQLYGVDAAVEKALGRQVWLKSGGYLVIDKTEALTVIDVNTGRYVGSRNLADTVFKINMEACEEIARQLRIRDIGGIIVVDFIDMDVAEHRQKLLQEMERQLRHDHTKTVLVGLTGLGLVEITRKKVRQSIDAVMMRMCPYCGGKGVVLSEETVAGRVRREIRRILGNSQCEAILVEVHPGVASYLIGPSGANLKDLEKETGRSVFVRGTGALHLEEMNVKAVGTRDEIAQKAVPVQVGDVIEVTVEEVHEKNPGDGIARREGFVVNVEGGASRVGQKVVVEIKEAHRTYAKARVVEPGPGRQVSGGQVSKDQVS